MVEDDGGKHVEPEEGEGTQAGTLALVVGYDGAGFCGFAAQPGQRTVAGEVVRALETFLRRDVELTCAGRTDAGVHALGQVVSIPVTESELEIPAGRILRSLTALTPDDISVREVLRGPAGFSARFDAVERRYRYRICTGEVRPVMARGYSWWLRHDLDLEAMREGAALLEGEHDFKSFCKAVSAQGRPTCRFVRSVEIREVREYDEPLVCIDVAGNAFLHSMVRTIAGTLVEVGCGRRPASWVGSVLAACDRSAAGPCAPAEGLTFMDVEYEPGVLVGWRQ